MGLRRFVLFATLFGVFFATPSPAASDAFVVTNWPGFTRGLAGDLVIRGDLAFVATGTGGVMVVNITDPKNPVLLGAIQTGWGGAIDFLGDLLVVVTDGPLRVFDVSDLNDPRLVGEHTLSHPFADLALHGNLALVASADLQILDLSVPSLPVHRASVPLTNATAVTVADNLAYVVVHQVGFLIFDITNPDAPVKVGQYESATQTQQIVVTNGMAFLGATPGGMEIVDISNPAAPANISNYLPPNQNGAFWDVSVSGDTAVIANAGGGLEIVNITDPAAPRWLASFDTPGVAARIKRIGSHAYLADSEGGLKIIDVSTPTNPIQLGSVLTDGSAFSVEVQGSRAFVADGSAGLKILELENESMALLSRVSTTGFTRSLVIRSNIAFVANAWAGFSIVDVRDAANPIVLTNLSMETTRPPMSPGAYAIALENDIALIASSSGAIHFYNVAAPASPVPLTRHMHTTGFNEAILRSRIAYLRQTHGLHVIDFTNLSKPVVLTNFTTSDFTSDLELSGNYLFLSANSAGLSVFDVSNPKDPRRVGHYSNGPTLGLTIAGNSAFLATRSPALDIIDIRNPAKLVRVSSIKLPVFASEITLQGNRALLSCFQDGVFMVDLSEFLGPSIQIRADTGIPSLEIRGRPGGEVVIEHTSNLSAAWSRQTPLILEHTRQRVPSVILPENGFYRAFWSRTPE